jgi:hypothetical protein
MSFAWGVWEQASVAEFPEFVPLLIRLIYVRNLITEDIGNVNFPFRN